MPFCNQYLRYSILILAVAFASLGEANAQSKVVEGLSFTSKTDHKINYAIYLPSDYEESMRSYPVLYLFHGLGNDESAWIQFGNMKSLMDSMYADDSITPMIVVMPYGGNSWFIDDLRSTYPFESLFISEFMDYVDSQYKTRPERKYRAFGGLSMGGYGALILAFRNPDVVSSVFSLSPGIWTDETIRTLSREDYLRTFGEIYTQDPTDRLTSHWKTHSVLQQAREINASELSDVRYYITSGDDDPGISTATAELHIILKNRGVPHEYRVYDGGHTWNYWRKTFPEAVRFISDEFQRGVE